MRLLTATVNRKAAGLPDITQPRWIGMSGGETLGRFYLEEGRKNMQKPSKTSTKTYEEKSGFWGEVLPKNCLHSVRCLCFAAVASARGEHSSPACGNYFLRIRVQLRGNRQHGHDCTLSRPCQICWSFFQKVSHNPTTTCRTKRNLGGKCQWPLFWIRDVHMDLSYSDVLRTFAEFGFASTSDVFPTDRILCRGCPVTTLTDVRKCFVPKGEAWQLVTDRGRLHSTWDCPSGF